MTEKESKYTHCIRKKKHAFAFSKTFILAKSTVSYRAAVVWLLSMLFLRPVAGPDQSSYSSPSLLYLQHLTCNPFCKTFIKRLIKAFKTERCSKCPTAWRITMPKRGKALAGSHQRMKTATLKHIKAAVLITPSLYGTAVHWLGQSKWSKTKDQKPWRTMFPWLKTFHWWGSAVCCESQIKFFRANTVSKSVSKTCS